MKMYEITEDLRAITELFESATDENGEPRELTDEEKTYLQECLATSKDDFEAKFDSYGKFMANLKAQSEIADGEKKALKTEMDRLSARAKVFTNRRDAMKDYLFFNMQNLGIDKYKSALFSVGIQLAPMSLTTTGAINNVPEQFLKPREISSSAIKQAIKDGEIVVTDDGKLFYDGELLNIKAERQSVLVVR